MGQRLQWETDGAAWPHRAASRFVDAGGVRWHVQVLYGAAQYSPAAAPSLWLLHGTGAASHSWRHLAPLLLGCGPVVVPDLPGHGFSSPLPAPQQSLTGMAAALAALAQALALPPGVLIGHSAGAALAVQAVQAGLLAPAQIIGINAALLPFDGLAGQVLGPMARWMSRQPLLPRLLARTARDGAAVRRLVQATGSRLDASGLALYGQLIRSPAHVAGALAMMSDWDLRALWHNLPRLPVPLSLLVGAQDSTVPPAQAQRTAQRLPGTRQRVLPGLGHLGVWAAEGRRLQRARNRQRRVSPPAPRGQALGLSVLPSGTRFSHVWLRRASRTLRRLLPPTLLAHEEAAATVAAALQPWLASPPQHAVR